MNLILFDFNIILLISDWFLRVCIDNRIYCFFCTLAYSWEKSFIFVVNKATEAILLILMNLFQNKRVNFKQYLNISNILKCTNHIILESITCNKKPINWSSINIIRSLIKQHVCARPWIILIIIRKAINHRELIFLSWSYLVIIISHPKIIWLNQWYVMTIHHALPHMNDYRFQIKMLKVIFKNDLILL